MWVHARIFDRIWDEATRDREDSLRLGVLEIAPARPGQADGSARSVGVAGLMAAGLEVSVCKNMFVHRQTHIIGSSIIFHLPTLTNVYQP